MNKDEFEQAIESVETPYGQISYFCNDLYLGRSLREYGEWAKKELDFLATLVKPGSVIIDAGAYIGTHTLAFSHFTGPEGQVYAFEPRKEFFRLLERNTKKNRLMNVRIFNAGLSDKNRSIHIEDVNIHVANSFGSMKLEYDNLRDNNLNAEIITIDSLNLESCDLIKLDVEGMENLILCGAINLLDTARPFVYAECNSADSSWPVVQNMWNFGYKVYLYSETAYNSDNYLKNCVNIFGNARELSLVCIPNEKDDSFRESLDRTLEIIPINKLDDLVLALIKKPQYKEEVLAHTSGVGRWGNSFWCTESELEQIKSHNEKLTLEASQAREQAMAQIDSLQQIVSERDEKITLLNEKITLLNQEIQKIRNSRSWLITSPLRRFRRLISIALPPYLVGNKVYRFSRAIFRLLPIAPSIQNRLRAFVVHRSRLFIHNIDIPTKLFVSGEKGIVPESLDVSSRVANGVIEWPEYSLFKLRLKAYEKQLQLQVAPKKEKLVSISKQKAEQVAESIQFKTEKQPVVSIVIPVFGNIALTLECLTTIARADVKVSYEIIIADDASPDNTLNVLSKIQGIRVKSNTENQGFIRNCNDAFRLVRGDYVVILNNDVQVSDGWLDGMLDVFSRHPDVGVVGPKIVYPSGYLQEAGISIKHDGTSDMVGLNDDPVRARYSYTRPVDYCSGAAIMLPTKLLRETGGFSEDFIPAYCEDADLCLRLSEKGYKTYYTADVTVIHHLSKTVNSISPKLKARQIAKNLDRLYRKWAKRIDSCSVRCIAFYLPQFHIIPENDAWWGKGFTEWTNVRKARPNFVGHYQPREPGELGYYDLSDPDVMERQADLARRYGIYGFCFYYYWFGGKRLLEKPIEQMLASGKPSLPFCLCWANENWTRRWDGRDQEILIGQQHSPADDRAVILDLIRYFRAAHYIRIDGKPLLLIYRVDLLPDFLETSKRWRETCREQGIGEIYLALVESHDLVHRGIHPSKFGCDAAVEFPPLNMAETIAPSGELINNKFSGAIGDYRETAFRYCTRELPPYKRFRGVMPGWDNTARRQNNSFCFEYASPGTFQAWLEHVITQTRQQMQGDERLVFINAWNEWAEGAYLEPDRKFGHAYLEAVRNAKDAPRLLKNSLPSHVKPSDTADIALIGHPFSPIGMGEHIRCTHRALRRVSLNSKILDIYKLDKTNRDFLDEFSSFIDKEPKAVNIFHINGDEVSQAMAHLTHARKWSGYNIIYPAWELGKYPQEWADQLDRFDEIWAPSKFIQESLSAVCKKQVIHMPLATEIALSSFLSRRYFGIPESDYVFLFLFDARSYVSRKNPYAVIDAFKKLVELRPHAKTTLVLKMHGTDLAPRILDKLHNDIRGVEHRTIIIDREMSDNEVKNLIRCCDSFISLHRSEGYGRGIAEAMALGKPVIATAYSGNMDFMTPETSLLVSYELIPLIKGDYPYYKNQVWADPDVGEAVDYMVSLIDDPEQGRRMGRLAQLSISKYFGYLAIGNRMLERIEEIKKLIC